ncbi:MAG: cytochrome c3 family protein [Thermodesulfobacteria bacterium]|nr:cytochrome c3 family protein [Thermodesulfobacteriota bacterium]
MKRWLLLLLVFVFSLAFYQPLFGQDEEEYPEEPIIFTKPVKAVIFDHKKHVEDAGLSCDDCHDELFEMAAGTAEENEDFNMESLYQGKYCGACHNGEMAFPANRKCTTCHIGVLGWQRLQQKSGEGESSSEGHH